METLNLKAALDHAGADADLLREVAGVYLEEAPRLREKIREAVTSGDAGTLCEAAHSLKGASASLGAERLAEIAHRLEIMGRKEDLGACAETLRELDSEFEKVRARLAELSDSEQPER